MEQGDIRIGIIGAGNNTRVMHIPKFKDIDGVEILAVCNRSRQSGEVVAREFNISKVYDNWKEIIEDVTLNAVVIGTWPYKHSEMTCAALSAGKHVLCEARMAMNANEAHWMMEASRSRSDLVAQIVPSPMTMAYDKTIARMISEGFCGEVYSVEVYARTPEFVDRGASMNWRQDAVLSGLNIMSMGIWYEAVARWVGHVSTVSAETRVFVNKRKDAAGNMVDITVPDHVTIIGGLERGGLLQMQVSGVSGEAPFPGDVFIYGSEGSIHLDLAAGSLKGATRSHSTWKAISIPDRERGEWRVEEEFVGAIRGKEDIKLTSFADAVRYMEFTEAVNHSATDGRRVTLPLLSGSTG